MAEKARIIVDGNRQDPMVGEITGSWQDDDGVTTIEFIRDGENAVRLPMRSSERELQAYLQGGAWRGSSAANA